jgi:hypothetical protein
MSRPVHQCQRDLVGDAAAGLVEVELGQVAAGVEGELPQVEGGEADLAGELLL